jgi:hypothetical protein
VQKVLTIRLALKDDGTVAGIERVSKSVDKLEHESDQATAATRRLSGEQQGAVAAIKALATAYGAGVLLRGMASAVRTGIEFNAQMEQSRLGIAALIGAFGQVRDASGNALNDFNTNLVLAGQLQEKLKIAALQTTAEYGEMVEALQVGIGPALKAGFNTDQIVEFTKMVTQAAGAIGLPMNQLGQEIRGLFAGDIGPDSRLANLLFTDIPRTKIKAYVEELQRSGKFFDEMKERMGAFAEAGERAQDTFSGALSNLKDAFGQALGEGTQGQFSIVTQMIRDITAQIVTFDEQGRATFNQDFVDGVQAIAGAFVSVADEVVNATKKLGEFIDFFGALKDIGPALQSMNQRIAMRNALLPGSGYAMALAGGDVGALDDQLMAAIAARRRSREMRQQSRTARSDDDAILAELAQSGTMSGAAGLTSLMRGRGLTISGRGTPAGGTRAGGATDLQGVIDDYKRFINDYRNAVAAGGDPLQEEIAQIISKREDTLIRLSEMQAKLKKAMGLNFDAAEAARDRKLISDHFENIIDKKTLDNWFTKAREGGKKTAEEWGAGMEALGDVVAGIQERTEERRLDAIEDGVERERQIRAKEIEEWYKQQEGKLALARRNGVETEQQERELAALRVSLLADNDARAKRSAEEQTRLRNEQLVGTREWARKMAREIGTIPEQVTAAIGNSKLALAGMFEGVIEDLIDGTADFGKSFENLTKDLASNWGRMLSDMLTKTIVNGESIVSQLKAVWSQLNQAGSPMDAGIAGAGMGSFVGNVFGQPNNYGALGGTIGGVVGGIAGYFAGNPALGAAIGSAIGTAIGTMIQKGEDFIRVSIVNGVATVTEKGISAGARHDVETQVQRRVKEETKAWQSILDLLPEHVRKALENLPRPKVNLSGEVVDADISDAGALGALGDFLGNDLPKATFAAYKESIETALGVMGVMGPQITKLFTYWGTLQGKELQDAVRGYVLTLVQGVDLRDKIGAPIGDRVTEARRLANQSSIGRMDDVRAQMATIVASASKLTDIEDVIAAQGQVNDLARQYYDMGIARLQRIDAIEENILATNANLREQIDLAGKSDQEKIDYFYSRLGDLRGELERATDPEEIARITADMQRYIQQAFGLAPGSQENRDKLREILGDIDALSSEGLQAAREEQERKDKEVRDLMQKQLDALLGIQAAVGDPNAPTPRPGNPDEPGPGGGPGPGPQDPHDDPDRRHANITSPDADVYRRLIEDVRRSMAAAEPAGGAQSQAEAQMEDYVRFLQLQEASSVGKSVGEELSRLFAAGVSIRGVIEEPLEIDNGGFGENLRTIITRDVILTFRNNPDVATGRG